MTIARDRALLVGGPYASLDSAIAHARRHRGVEILQVKRGRWVVVRGPARDPSKRRGSKTDVRFSRVSSGLYLLAPDSVRGRGWLRRNLPGALRHKTPVGWCWVIEGNRNAQEIYVGMLESGLRVVLQK